MKFHRITSSAYLISLILFSCSQKQQNKKTENYQDDSSKVTSQILNKKKNGFTIMYFQNGGVESIKNYINDSINGEALWFYPNGKLQEKSTFDKSIQHGISYYFYPSGIMKSYRLWENNHQISYGEDYWDFTGQTKTLYYFNSDGTIAYKKYLDSLGHPVGEEGVHP